MTSSAGGGACVTASSVLESRVRLAHDLVVSAKCVKVPLMPPQDRLDLLPQLPDATFAVCIEAASLHLQGCGDSQPAAPARNADNAVIAMGCSYISALQAGRPGRQRRHREAWPQQAGAGSSPAIGRPTSTVVAETTATDRSQLSTANGRVLGVLPVLAGVPVSVPCSRAVWRSSPQRR